MNLREISEARLPDNWIASELSDFQVSRRCGIHAWERHPERPNLLSVSIRMYGAYTNGSSLQIDYDPIRAHLLQWPQMPHIDTLEAIADELFPIAFMNPVVIACWIKLSKPHIFSEAGGAGIEIFRWRNAQSRAV